MKKSVPSYTETTLYNWLYGAKRTFGNRLRLERVENCVSDGMPDVDGTLDGEGFKIELKVCKPNTEGFVKIDMKRSQFIWFKNSTASGTCAYILIMFGKINSRFLLSVDSIDLLTEEVHTDILLEHSFIKPDATAEEIIRKVIA